MSRKGSGLGLGLIAGTLIVQVYAGPAAQAACATPNSCYGVATWRGAPDSHGARTNITVHCLRVDNPDRFILNSLWVITNGGWVETGMEWGNPWDRRYWYWADKRPGYQFFKHDFLGLPVQLDTSYTASIVWGGNQSWEVKRDGDVLGTSTPNPGPSNGMDAGIESTTINANGNAHSRQLEREDDEWSLAIWVGFSEPGARRAFRKRPRAC